MGSKRKSRGLSYQWRLFIPLVVSLWVIIFSMTYWQYRNERNYRRELFTSQLELVNQRIVAAYETNLDPNAFVSFVVKYYRDSPLYDQLRVSIYQDGQLIKAWGEPIGLDEDEQKMGKGITRTPEIDRSVDDTRPEDGFFFYNITNSKDKHLTVCTVLPMDSDIKAAALPSSDIFKVVIVLAIVVTVFAWWSTRYLSRNLRILRTIAENAAADTNFIPTMQYPHDELGDISRKISQMYNERSEAMERQKREHEIALHAIEEKARSKRQLTNNINHELRTPIGVIKGYIDTILENPDMDEASRTHFLRKASEHVDRLVNLIADVSAITRLEEGGDMISTEELDYHDVAYTIASDLEESGAMGNMAFRWNVPLDCKIMGNYNLLSGMLLNLCKNAAAYSRGTMCELVMTGEDSKFYYFDFRDDGRGVSPEHLPHLFERFYRIDSGRSRKAGGTGLGLPIVQNTILAHGGTITVENGELGGLSFKFSLPKFQE